MGNIQSLPDPGPVLTIHLLIGVDVGLCVVVAGAVFLEHFTRQSKPLLVFVLSVFQVMTTGCENTAGLSAIGFLVPQYFRVLLWFFIVRMSPLVHFLSALVSRNMQTISISEHLEPSVSLHMLFLLFLYLDFLSKPGCEIILVLLVTSCSPGFKVTTLARMEL